MHIAWREGYSHVNPNPAYGLEANKLILIVLTIIWNNLSMKVLVRFTF